MMFRMLPFPSPRPSPHRMGRGGRKVADWREDPSLSPWPPLNRMEWGNGGAVRRSVYCSSPLSLSPSDGERVRVRGNGCSPSTCLLSDGLTYLRRTSSSPFSLGIAFGLATWFLVAAV